MYIYIYVYNSGCNMFISLVIATKTDSNCIESVVLERVTSIIIIDWIPQTLRGDPDSLASEFSNTDLET